MSSIDRTLRVIIAAVIVTLYAMDKIQGTLGLTLIVVAIIFVLTSLINFCPIYGILGIRKWEHKDHSPKSV